MKRIVSLFIIMLCAASVIGCAGARAKMKFDDLQYPCSMSPFLYGSKGEVLVKDRDFEVVSQFQYEKTFWGIGWSFIPLSSEKDVVEAMNNDILAKGGVGMVNVNIHSMIHPINNIPVYNLIPIFPGATKVKVYGEVIKLKDKKI